MYNSKSWFIFKYFVISKLFVYMKKYLANLHSELKGQLYYDLATTLFSFCVMLSLIKIRLLLLTVWRYIYVDYKLLKKIILNLSRILCRTVCGEKLGQSKDFALASTGIATTASNGQSAESLPTLAIKKPTRVLSPSQNPKRDWFGTL